MQWTPRSAPRWRAGASAGCGRPVPARPPEACPLRDLRVPAVPVAVRRRGGGHHRRVRGGLACARRRAGPPARSGGATWSRCRPTRTTSRSWCGSTCTRKTAPTTATPPRLNSAASAVDDHRRGDRTVVVTVTAGAVARRTGRRGRSASSRSTRS